jgi:hypothetical protein
MKEGVTKGKVLKMGRTKYNFKESITIDYLRMIGIWEGKETNGYVKKGKVNNSWINISS